MTTTARPESRAISRSPAPLVVFAAIGVLAVASLLLWLALKRPQAYYDIVQEDGVIEWATFWTFLLASLNWLASRARLPRAVRSPLGLWTVLIAAFSMFVAMEEISWGQRILGYRPPPYFLERNFQQELNVHNVASQSLREALLAGVLGGWGVVLPVLARWSPLARLAAADSLGHPPRADVLVSLLALAPPLGFVPVFVFALALQVSYPVPFTNEIVELMLGLGMLFTSLQSPAQAGSGAAPPASPRLLRNCCMAIILMAFATVASAAWSSRRPASAEMIAAAQGELHALAADFVEIARSRGEAPTGCGLHKRLYTFVNEYRVEELNRLAFASLAARTAPSERIKYFLDPWNSPYWIRDHCSPSGRRRAAFVYSFGPNQRRDSSPWKLGGDDLGIYLARPRPRDSRHAAR